MGFLDYFTTPKTPESYQGNSLSNQERGLGAMQQWHNYSIMKYPNNYSLTFEQLQTQTGAITRFVAEGIGMTIDVNSMTDTQIQKSMQNLSDAGQGRIPAGVSDWINAMINVSANPSFLETAEGAAVQTAKDVSSGLQQVGDTVLTTASSLKVVLPILVVGAVVLIVYDKAKAV